jgi:hypothetical protein
MGLTKYPIIEGAIIKVVGIFDFNKKYEESLSSSLGYDAIPPIEYSHAQFYRDKYYKEFNELMLTQDADNAIKAFEKYLNRPIKFKKGDIEVNAKVSLVEIKLFENNIGVFAITVEPERLTFEDISDCNFCFRMFSSLVIQGESQILFHEWISLNILGGKSLRSTSSQHVDSDDYSGSKFKIYTAISVKEGDETDYNRDELLFELGTNAKLGSVSSKSYDSPSVDYFYEVMTNKVNPFNSSSGLALLDSYTVIGNDLFYLNGNLHRNNYSSYNHVYFSIYLYNLYIKYNVFRFNSKFKDDPVKFKGKFEDFINNYNFNYISFDFLPNIIYSKMRQALGIEQEIKLFEKRLNSLAANIQEEQEKRQAALLGIISIISSISAIEPILDTTEEIRLYSGLNNVLFYFLISIVLILVGIPILSYLFPHHAKKVWKKVNLYFKND